MLAPLVLLLIVPSAEPNEAEKLFRQMETKVMQAKTLECTYEGKVDYKEAEDDQKDTLKGKLLLGEGNKLRIDFSGMGEKGTIISDGTKWRLIGDKNKETPKWLGKSVRALMARTCAGYASIWAAPDSFLRFMTPPITEFKIDEHFPVTDFKFGKKEMIDKQEAQIVQYTGPGVEVSIWIDTKTYQPLKRVFTDKEKTLTETYTNLKLDGKVDPKQFELPKD